MVKLVLVGGSINPLNLTNLVKKFIPKGFEEGPGMELVLSLKAPSQYGGISNGSVTVWCIHSCTAIQGPHLLLFETMDYSLLL